MYLGRSVQTLKIDTWTGGLGNRRTSGDHPNYSIIEIDQNNEEISGELKRVSAHSDTSGKPSVITGVKNSQTSKIIEINIS